MSHNCCKSSLFSAINTAPSAYTIICSQYKVLITCRFFPSSFNVLVHCLLCTSVVWFNVSALVIDLLLFGFIIFILISLCNVSYFSLLFYTRLLFSIRCKISSVKKYTCIKKIVQPNSRHKLHKIQTCLKKTSYVCLAELTEAFIMYTPLTKSK